MINFLFAVILFSILFVLMSISVIVGRRYGLWHMRHESRNEIEVISVAEGAVFALLGLLVAFTFTGAHDRFETRAKMITDEANAIRTVWYDLGMLSPAAEEPLQKSIRQYLDSRLATYTHLPYYRAVMAEWRTTKELQYQIWQQLLLATRAAHDEPTTELLLPAANSMFDIAFKRFEMTRNHPPVAVYALLIGLAMLSSFLAGFTTADKRVKKSVHIISYVVIVSITLYIIIDMEFPRLGLIREDAYDRVLIELRESMQST